MSLEKRHPKKEEYKSPEQKPLDPPPEYFDAVFQKNWGQFTYLPFFLTNNQKPPDADQLRLRFRGG